MKVTTPVGDYDYRVTGISRQGGNIVVAGAMGVWDTTMVIEPKDWVELGRRIALPAAVIGLGLAFRHRRRGKT